MNQDQELKSEIQSFALTPTMKVEIRLAAKLHGITTSEAIRRAVEHFIENTLKYDD